MNAWFVKYKKVLYLEIYKSVGTRLFDEKITVPITYTCLDPLWG